MRRWETHSPSWGSVTNHKSNLTSNKGKIDEFNKNTYYMACMHTHESEGTYLLGKILATCITKHCYLYI
jgi:hypothetical protein